MGGVGWLACQGFLVSEACVRVLVELDFFCLECNEVSSSGFCDVSGFGVTLGSLYIEAQGYVLVLLRICMVCLALVLVGSWVVLVFIVGMEAFDKLLLINVPWSQEFSGVLRIWT